MSTMAANRDKNNGTDKRVGAFERFADTYEIRLIVYLRIKSNDSCKFHSPFFVCLVVYW